MTVRNAAWPRGLALLAGTETNPEQDNQMRLTYQEATNRAEHLIALGMGDDVYLSGDRIDDKPWQHVESVEPGGTHRMEMATSVWFRATDPTTKLHFRWTFDIEPRGVNGKGHYEIDVDGCRRVLKALPYKGRKQFTAYLADCAARVRAKADEWKDLANRQLRDAKMLEKLSR